MRPIRIMALVMAASTVVFSQWANDPVEAKTPKDTLVVAQDLTGVFTVDPAFTYGNIDVEIPNNMYDRLIKTDPEDATKVTAGLAEEWEVSPDGTTIRFHLKKGLKFHSGNPITTEDVEFSLRRLIELDALLSVFPARLGWTKTNLDDAIKVIDPYTIDLKVLKDITPSLALTNIGTVMSAVVDKKVALAHEQNGDMGREWLKSHSAGSGPFRLASYNPTEAIVLEANPDYYLGAPAMKRVILQHVQEPSSQRLLLESGDIDIARNLTRDQFNALRESGKANVQIDPKLEMISLQINSEAMPAFGHPKVRQAMRWLIDYQGMAETLLKDDMKVAQTFWPHGDLGIPNIYSLDTSRAKELLAEAGYPDGFEFTMEVFNSAPWTQIAQSIKSTMATAGIIANIVASDKKAVFSKHRSRSYEALINSNTADYMDPDFFSPFFWNPDDSDEAKMTNSFAWRVHWDIPALSIIAELARAEQDPVKRDKMYKALQIAVQHGSPIIFMFIRNHQTGVAHGVTDFAPLPTWGGVFYYGVHKS